MVTVTEVNCRNCGFSYYGNNKSILRCKKSIVQNANNLNYACWKPKENKMNKIQMTEEQAIDLLSNCLFVVRDDVDGRIRSMMDEMFLRGYIKKSDLEIAQHNYNIDPQTTVHIVNLITELKKEIAKLKGEKHEVS